MQVSINRVSPSKFFQLENLKTVSKIDMAARLAPPPSSSFSLSNRTFLILGGIAALGITALVIYLMQRTWGEKNATLTVSTPDAEPQLQTTLTQDDSDESPAVQQITAPTSAPASSTEEKKPQAFTPPAPTKEAPEIVEEDSTTGNPSKEVQTPIAPSTTPLPSPSSAEDDSSTNNTPTVSSEPSPIIEAPTPPVKNPHAHLTFEQCLEALETSPQDPQLLERLSTLIDQFSSQRDLALKIEGLSLPHFKNVIRCTKPEKMALLFDAVYDRCEVSTPPEFLLLQTLITEISEEQLIGAYEAEFFFKALTMRPCFMRSLSMPLFKVLFATHPPTLSDSGVAGWNQPFTKANIEILASKLDKNDPELTEKLTILFEAFKADGSSDREVGDLLFTNMNHGLILSRSKFAAWFVETLQGNRDYRMGFVKSVANKLLGYAEALFDGDPKPAILAYDEMRDSRRVRLNIVERLKYDLEKARTTFPEDEFSFFLKATVRKESFFAFFCALECIDTNDTARAEKAVEFINSDERYRTWMLKVIPSILEKNQWRATHEQYKLHPLLMDPRNFSVES